MTDTLPIEKRAYLFNKDKSNILPSLLPSAAKALQKQIAGKWNSKRTQKDIENDIFYSPNDVTHATIEDVIKHTGAKKFSQAAAKYRASKAIRIADFTKKVTLVCPDTGINAVVDIPSVPGFYLPYQNPLSILANARAIVQKGYAYLLKLDTQILAGLLITIADDYSLFQYPTFSNGINKNALLRSAGKNELIKALLFIEEKIHSENYSLLPRLSFIADFDAKQWAMEARLNNWLQIIQKELEAPTVVFPSAPISTFNQKLREEKKVSKEAEKQERKALLSFNKSLAEAIGDAKTLCKDGLINQKLRNLLISLLDKDIFPSLESSTKAKISLKLATLPIESRITNLIKIFEREVIFSGDRDDILEDFSAPSAPIPVPMKTAFELQNSPEVIAAEKERIRAKRYADQQQQAQSKFIEDMMDIGTGYHQPNMLLLTMDKNVGTGYDSILLNHKPIPEGRYQLQAIREAFSIVQNYKAPAPVLPPEPVAYIGHPEQQTPALGNDISMIEIAPGIMAPTLLWNSMSEFKQRLYKRKLMMAKGQ